MGMAIELLAGQVTAPSTTLTALTMGSGNSLTMRNTAGESKAKLLAAWADVQTAGTLRMRSPTMHDNVQGIRFATVASHLQPLTPLGAIQEFYGQETVTVELSGSATGGDIESAAMLMFYDDVPGIDARLVHWNDIRESIVALVTVENTLSLGTAGGYSGEEAINAEFDLLRADTEYALIGYQVSAECVAVRWRGVDTGNLGIGGPGADDSKHLTGNWFINLSLLTGLPCIPVFNSSNKAGILIDGMQDENGTDVTVTSIFAQLKKA